MILFKSVFTHLRPGEVENYLKEVSRLLKEDGRCLATFFLLNQEQELLAARGSNALKFNFGDEQWRYVYEHSPESACAYEENFILGLLKNHDLTLASPAYYGSWSGREKACLSRTCSSSRKLNCCMRLSTSMTAAQFDNGYWYALELKEFAKRIGIPSANKLRKDELERAIRLFLETGKIKTPTKRTLSNSA